MAEFIGAIKSFNPTKGWGFVESAQTQKLYGKDIFVLKTALPGGHANTGDQVAFQVVQGDRGPQAAEVRLLSGGPPAYRPPPPPAQPGYFASGAPIPSVPMAGAYGGGSQYHGTVKSFNPTKGWGFLTSDAVLQMFGKDIFFMKSAVIGGYEPQQNQPVSFTVTDGDRGPQASNIQLQMQGAPPVHNAYGRAPAPMQAPRASPYGAPAVGHVIYSLPGMAPSAMGAPMVSPDQHFFGTVRSYNDEKGWGHVECEAAKKAFGKEIFLLRSALGEASPTMQAGTMLGFKVKMTAKGPQACDVAALPQGCIEYNGLPGSRYSGVVKSFNAEKGWGFVTSEEITNLFFGKDIFLRRQALDPNGPQPSVGDGAEFSIEVSDSGKLQAKDVFVGPANQGAGYGAVKGAGVTHNQFSPY
ncbi:unnamed protein product [Polarella glacialis]|uniref:CSD domain-containing protein n=1 Tax=Polarella glacialis TaxID=89957 RepID=A0A813GKC6_POLGL|nr:unnamed protein product [Polarella glacialis]